VINVSNSTSKNNPVWLMTTPVGPTRPSGPAGLARAGARRPGLAATGFRGLRALAGAGRILAAAGRILASTGRILATAGRVLATAGQIFLSCLAAFPGRLGGRLFVMNDTEAYWRDWQIIKTHGGLGRRYRDPRFDLLAECLKCRGAGSSADLPCPPCLGTGRTTREEV
jgi:hypothetical protein